MCLWRDGDQRKNLELRNILFTVKLCHFLRLGHIQRDELQMTHESTMPRCPEPQKKMILAPPAESVNEPPAVRNREVRRLKLRTRVFPRVQVAVRRHTADFVSMLTSSLFRQKQRGRWGDGGSMYFLCRYSVVRFQRDRNSFFLAIMFFFYYIFHVKCENWCKKKSLVTSRNPNATQCFLKHAVLTRGTPASWWILVLFS